jgi:hypothetical protein
MKQIDFALIELQLELVICRSYIGFYTCQGDNMAYLTQPTSTSEFGLVKVGNNIDVFNGEISIDQCISPTCDVEFHNLNVTGLLTVDNVLVVLSVTPEAGPGISITDLTSSGYDVEFTINNTGVLSLIAGTGISLSGSTGNITISSSGTTQINTIGVTTSYTALNTDDYIGVNSTSATNITLPIGTNGKVFTIKEEHGPGKGQITIIPAIGEKIDNSNTFTITATYQSVTLVFRNTQWHVI